MPSWRGGHRADRDARARPSRARAGFARRPRELGLGGDAELAYRPRSRASDAEELRAELAERRDSDLARGFSGHGPHLDELAIASTAALARRYASQGQQRIALLALLFAERDALLPASAPPPMLLLDDVTSELDPDRRERLCARLAAGGGQALITATEADHLPRRAPRAARCAPSATAAGVARIGGGVRRPRGSAPRSAARPAAAAGVGTGRGPRRGCARKRCWRRSRRRGRGSPAATVAAQADPVSEREGVVTIACRSATWAQELDLMQAELLPRLREALAGGPSRTAWRAFGSPPTRARTDRLILLAAVYAYLQGFCDIWTAFRPAVLVSLCELGSDPDPSAIRPLLRARRSGFLLDQNEEGLVAKATSAAAEQGRAKNGGGTAEATTPRARSQSSAASTRCASARACTSARPVRAACTTWSTRSSTTRSTRRWPATATASRSRSTPTSRSRSSTTAAASRSTSTRRRSAPRPRSC